jgi:microfibrillar-associated protein 1
MSTVLATQVRKHTVKPTRAAGRYWKGKVPKGAAEYHSDSEDEDEEQPELQEEGDVLIAGEQDIVEEEDDDEALPVKTGQDRVMKTMNLTLKDVNISKEGKVIVAGREESGRTRLEEGTCYRFGLRDVVKFVGEDILEDEEEEEEEEAPDEEEEDEEGETEVRFTPGVIHAFILNYFQSSESEEEPSKPLFRPVFVPKYVSNTCLFVSLITAPTDESE